MNFKHTHNTVRAKHTRHWQSNVSDSVFAVQGFPTTYFVDSEGRILTEPIAGADVKAYKEAYKEALKAVKK